MMADVKYYAKENIINTKRDAMNVSREEAIRLVAEDVARARAENIILKQQMKEKLARLELISTLKFTQRLIDHKKEEGIHLSFEEAFSEIRRRQARADKI